MSRDRGGSWYKGQRDRRETFAGHRRRVQGDRAFLKLLRRMPDAARESMADMLEDAGGEVLAAMRAEAPVKTGAVRSGLSMRVSRRTMRMRIGILGRANARRLFYGRIVDLGRKAQTVSVRRRGRAAIAKHGKRTRHNYGHKIDADIVSTYRLRVRAMTPRRFVTGQKKRFHNIVGPRIDAFWGRMLEQASAGVSDD